MTDTGCKHLDENGLCRGKYKGFACIGDRCQDPTRGPGAVKCRHGRADGYCMKHRKFECRGEDCPDLEV